MSLCKPESWGFAAERPVRNKPAVAEVKASNKDRNVAGEPLHTRIRGSLRLFLILCDDDDRAIQWWRDKSQHH